MYFVSDNGAPCPQQIMTALMAANDGPAMPYGNCALTARAVARVREVLEAPAAEVALVVSGTAANALALATLCPPWGAVFCHESAHIAVDECGAPEFFSAGAKLLSLLGRDGKIAPEALSAAVSAHCEAPVHAVQPAVLSLTCMTESGTLYTPEEIAELSRIAHAAGLSVHLDGARLANALATLKVAPGALTWQAGIDALSLGGTKNGLLAAEAVVLFDPAGARELALRRKRAGHLVSKHRYLAAQIDAWLENGLWLDLAGHANRLAARLAAGLGKVQGARLAHPVEGNIVFVDLPPHARAAAQAAGAAFYEMDGNRVRLVTSWATTQAEVDAFLSVLARA